jgi:predicted deacetylase
MPVHVSIHDVSPVWAHEVQMALDLCRAVSVRPALLVVPNFHERAPLLDDEPFCAWLRELQAGGHETYLHGFSHKSAERYDAARGHSRLAWHYAQRVASGGEAEMRDVSEFEGRKRIEEGHRVLERAGLRADGFVAPAWSMPRWLLPVLAERGCRFTESHWRVYDPAARHSRPSFVLNWASRSPLKVIRTVATCRLGKYGRAVMPARVAIHPGDMRLRLLRDEIAKLLAWFKGDFVEHGRDLLAG